MFYVGLFCRCNGAPVYQKPHGIGNVTVYLYRHTGGIQNDGFWIIGGTLHQTPQEACDPEATDKCPLARLDTNTAAGGCSRSPDDPSCTWRECKYYFNQGCFVDATKGNGATWSAAKVLMMASNPAATAVPHSRPKPETAFLDLTMQHYAARNTFSLTIGGDTSMAPNGTQWHQWHIPPHVPEVLCALDDPTYTWQDSRVQPLLNASGGDGGKEYEFRIVRSRIRQHNAATNVSSSSLSKGLGESEWFKPTNDGVVEACNAVGMRPVCNDAATGCGGGLAGKDPRAIFLGQDGPLSWYLTAPQPTNEHHFPIGSGSGRVQLAGINKLQVRAVAWAHV